MTEDEWWKQCKILQREVDQAAQNFYAVESINSQAAANAKLLSQMQPDAEFWNTTTHAYQTTFFITMGRIFDKDKRSHSMDNFLKKTAIKPEFFFKTSLGKTQDRFSPWSIRELASRFPERRLGTHRRRPSGNSRST